MSYTYARLRVSRVVFDEIALKLKDAGCAHAFVDGLIDMHGIALELEGERIFALVEYDDYVMFSRELEPLARYWWDERRKPEGNRPDIVEIEIGKRDGVCYLSDQEVTDFCNKRGLV